MAEVFSVLRPDMRYLPEKTPLAPGIVLRMLLIRDFSLSQVKEV